MVQGGGQLLMSEIPLCMASVDGKDFFAPPPLPSEKGTPERLWYPCNTRFEATARLSLTSFFSDPALRCDPTLHPTFHTPSPAPYTLHPTHYILHLYILHSAHSQRTAHSRNAACPLRVTQFRNATCTRPARERRNSNPSLPTLNEMHTRNAAPCARTPKPQTPNPKSQTTNPKP